MKPLGAFMRRTGEPTPEEKARVKARSERYRRESLAHEERLSEEREARQCAMWAEVNKRFDRQARAILLGKLEQ